MIRIAFYRLRLRIPIAALAVAAAIMMLVFAPRYAVCLPNEQQKSDAAAIQELLDQLDDIDVMRSIVPLKLTGEQIDKLIAAITDAKTSYDKRIGDLSASTVGKMADEIHKRHKEAVGGGAASTEFDSKVKKMMADFYSKRDEINGDNLVAMTGQCGKIITPSQQKIAAQLEKDTMVKLGKKLNPADTTAQYFNLYVVDLFIGYRRIVPLLKEMKSSAG